MFVSFKNLSPEEQEARRYQLQKEEEERYAHWKQLQEEYRKEAEERALRNMQLYDNPQLFLSVEGLYTFDPDGCISSRELYDIYRQWCIREGFPIFTPRTFWLRMKEYAPHHALIYCTFTGSNGKRCRGFRGIRPLHTATDATDKDIAV